MTDQRQRDHVIGMRGRTKELIAYEKRVRELEAEGCSRSDAQAVADAELEQRS